MHSAQGLISGAPQGFVVFEFVMRASAHLHLLDPFTPVSMLFLQPPLPVLVNVRAAAPHRGAKPVNRGMRVSGWVVDCSR